MLHRNTSSRRRRASRSAASSPQTRAPRSPQMSPNRRASIAVSPVEPNRNLLPEMNRSPRHSMVPDISLSRNSLDSDSPENSPRNSLMPEKLLSPRGSLIPDSALSPRNSLIPEMNRSPRNSLTPEGYGRSPRNSLVPDSAMSPRNSLIPDSALSPRNSLIPEFNRSPRNSLIPSSIPENALSPRNSIIPDSALSPRNSLVPDTFNRSPRNSIIPDPSRSPRGSLVPESRSPRHSLVPDSYSSRVAQDFNRSPRNSLVPERRHENNQRHLVPSESVTWNQRSPIEEGTRSPRHTSPRGSIAERTSPRESICEFPEDSQRSPRGSVCQEFNRSPRGSVGHKYDGKSPRGSLTLTFQEPMTSERRYSADNQPSKPMVRSNSPYRMSLKGPQVNHGYTASTSESGSRRPSSSVSQVSAEEQRRLCSERTALSSGMGGGCGDGGEEGQPPTLGLSLATYGSVAYQLKDANVEASGTCDFVCRAMRIVNKTVAVTVVLVCLSTLPLLMLIMGVQFLRDCPREPHIPIYMVVGGSLGCIKMSWLVWRQLGNRHHDDSASSSSATSRVASLALTVFLTAWFLLGNYWVLRIRWPDFAPTLYEPNRWCHRTLYIFSLLQLGVVWTAVAAVCVLALLLAGCQLVGWRWLGPHSYK